MIVGRVLGLGLVVLGVSACSYLERGTSGTTADVHNTCEEDVTVLLASDLSDLDAETQRQGLDIVAGGTGEADAINPPRDREGLVLRVSPLSGEPILVVPIQKNRDIEVDLAPSLCTFMKGLTATCRASLDYDVTYVLSCDK